MKNFTLLFSLILLLTLVSFFLLPRYAEVISWLWVIEWMIGLCSLKYAKKTTKSDYGFLFKLYVYLVCIMALPTLAAIAGILYSFWIFILPPFVFFLYGLYKRVDNINS